MVAGDESSFSHFYSHSPKPHPLVKFTPPHLSSISINVHSSSFIYDLTSPSISQQPYVSCCSSKFLSLSPLPLCDAILSHLFLVIIICTLAAFLYIACILEYYYYYCNMLWTCIMYNAFRHPDINKII